MSNLGVKDEIANQVVLAYESWSIFTKIMENFHYLIWLHYLFESMYKGINCFQVNNEALTCKVYLNQLHLSVFGQTFTIYTKNRGIFSFGCIQNGLW